MTYQALRARVPETVGILQLEYGDYADDFEAGGYIVGIDLDQQTPIFTYPVPGEPGEVTPPGPPLSEQVAVLKQQLAEQSAIIASQAEENTMNQLALMELHMLILNMMGGESE